MDEFSERTLGSHVLEEDLHVLERDGGVHKIAFMDGLDKGKMHLLWMKMPKNSGALCATPDKTTSFGENCP